ncbi:MAG: hypothetical protein V4582_03285 [Pseudomonadota bacterium]
MPSKPQQAASAAPVPPATPGEAGSALSASAQVEQLADQLSACADQLHARVLKAIRSGPGETPGITLELARAMFEEEATLRQRADGLYADAAAHTVQGLGPSQQHVIALTAVASEQIRHIAMLGDAAGVVSAMLMLAGAAAAGEPGALLLALENLRHQSAALAAHSPAPPPDAFEARVGGP